MSYLMILMSFVIVFSGSNAVSADKSLYERIGGEKKAREIVSDIWDNHSKNPIVKDRFSKSNPEYVKQRVFEIFAAATGATDVSYNGLDMKAAHTGMNISEMEFNAVVDDVLAACASNGVQQQELNEVLAILWSVRKDIVNSNILTDSLISSTSSSQPQQAHKQESASSGSKAERDAHYCLKSHEC